MTYLEAARAILSEARQPLHYQEITRRALDKGLIAPTGLTPDATMGSRLYTETSQDGSQFVRAGPGLFDLTQRRPGGIDAQVRQISEATRNRLRDLLEKMPPDRFEALITGLLIQMGFDESTVTLTPYCNDGGIDVTGMLRAGGVAELNAAVQVKRWKQNVSAPMVTQLRGSLQVHQQGIMITTSNFTKSAQAEAKAAGKTRISLINGEKLLDLLFRYKVGVLEKTLTVMSIDEGYWGELGTSDKVGDPAVEPVTIVQIDTTTQKTKLDTPASMGISRSISLTEDPTGLKPIGFTLFGIEHPAASWKDIWIGVASEFVQRHEDKFAATVTEWHGRKRRYFAPNPEGMFSPVQIPGAALWAETNLNAKNIVDGICRLLDAFGHDLAAVSISVRTQAHSEQMVDESG